METWTQSFRYGDRDVSFPVHATPAQINALIDEGFFVREDLISEPLLGRLRGAVDEVAARERARGAKVQAGGGFGGQFLRHLFDKDEVFLELLKFAPTLSVVRAVMGARVRARLSARVSFPDESGQETPWHSHTDPPPSPIPALYSFPHTIDVLIYLDPVNDANGLLSVLPGSHRIHSGISGDFADKDGQVNLTLPAGAGVFLHNHLWHRATPTTSRGSIRRMLALTYYPAWFFGSRIDGPAPEDGLTQRVVDPDDEEAAELLGWPFPRK